MLTRKEYSIAQKRAAKMIAKSGIKITEEEKNRISVADFGLSNLDLEGGQILTFFNTERISTKVIALFPRQTLPEHWHPSIGDNPGKEEVIRVITGTLYFYCPGEENMVFGKLPIRKDKFYTARHEKVMHPGDQFIIEPGVIHWFQAGDEGSVVFSFSTCASDLIDCFTDPNIVRETRIINEVNNSNS